jgi:hypothetical protein
MLRSNILRAVLLVVAATAANTVGLHAQGTPAATAAAQREPAGYIRVWDFATSFKSPIDVSLAGGTSPITLAYSMKPGQLGSYRQLPVGRYRVSIRAADPEALKPGSAPAPNRNPELVPATTVDVTDLSFRTLILRDEAGVPKPVLIDDATGASSRGRRLRVFNFAPADQQITVKVLNTDVTLWRETPTGMSEHVFSPDTRAVNLAVAIKLATGRESTQIVEADFGAALGVSLAIFADADGALTVRSFSDATL